MLPKFKPGDALIVSTFPYLVSSPKIGDVISFKHRDKIMVKRIKKISPDKIFVEGDNTKDSLKVGWINKRVITGKVIGKI